MDTIAAVGSAFTSGVQSLSSSATTPWDALIEGGDGASPAASGGGADAALPGGPVATAFGQVLGGFLRQVDSSQHQADAMVESLALGEPVDVHQVMLALNEASDAMHLTLEVRGKVLDAYQALMQMQL